MFLHMGGLVLWMSPCYETNRKYFRPVNCDATHPVDLFQPCIVLYMTFLIHSVIGLSVVAVQIRYDPLVG